MIDIQNVSFRYDHSPVLRDVSGWIPGSKLTFLLGENGSGKTTLLKCILKLLPYSGDILINGQSNHSFSIPELAKQVAYIPQIHQPRFNFQVRDVVLMGVSSRLSLFGQPKAEDVTIAQAALDKLNIGHLADRGYAELSGGERQMVLIARALAQQANILIMDEPTASLDFGNQIRLLEHCRSLTAQGLTIVITSHQPQHALQFSDHAILLHRGQVLDQGDPKDILNEVNLYALYGIQLVVEDLNGVKLPYYPGGNHVLE